MDPDKSALQEVAVVGLKEGIGAGAGTDGTGLLQRANVPLQQGHI
ncbi:MAG: hypothetical protein JWS11_2166 [Cypionkella sp.]|nr:hypothetical protein [Cypionkella sp.]